METFSALRITAYRKIRETDKIWEFFWAFAEKCRNRRRGSRLLIETTSKKNGGKGEKNRILNI